MKAVKARKISQNKANGNRRERGLRDGDSVVDIDSAGCVSRPYELPIACRRTARSVEGVKLSKLSCL